MSGGLNDWADVMDSDGQQIRNDTLGKGERREKKGSINGNMRWDGCGVGKVTRVKKSGEKQGQKSAHNYERARLGKSLRQLSFRSASGIGEKRTVGKQTHGSSKWEWTGKTQLQKSPAHRKHRDSDLERMGETLIPGQNLNFDSKSHGCNVHVWELGGTGGYNGGKLRVQREKGRGKRKK